MHVFKLHHGEMNPKERRETERTMFWQFSVNAVSFQQLKTWRIYLVSAAQKSFCTPLTPSLRKHTK